MLARVVPYMGLTKTKLSINSFFAGIFNLCSLRWLIHSRFNNNRVKYLYRRCLGLIYNYTTFSYEELEKDGSVTLYHKNIQKLAFGMLNIKNLMSLEISLCPVWEITKTLDNKFFYLLYEKCIMVVKVYLHLVSKIWNNITTELKQESSLKPFKESSKPWKPEHCPWKLSKSYINGA